MIKIETDLEMLKAQVDELIPNWRSRAVRRTAKFIKQKRYEENTSIWSEIKPIFMYLQKNRCAYCDRYLAGKKFGSGEHDLEHFRPKGRIEPYPTPDDGVMYPFSTGDSHINGYYWLAYNLENYAVACITCNRGLKADRFPIAGTRGAAETSLAELNQTELPLLLFPLLDDPEEFITFNGTTPEAIFKHGIKYQRALVTINFFGLADVHRVELYLERSIVICLIWTQDKVLQTSSDKSETNLAQQVIDGLCSSDSHFGHSACAKTFRALLRTDPIRAWGIYQEAAEFVALKN
jgi:hypothetical protein